MRVDKQNNIWTREKLDGNLTHPSSWYTDPDPTLPPPRMMPTEILCSGNILQPSRAALLRDWWSNAKAWALFINQDKSEGPSQLLDCLMESAEAIVVTIEQVNSHHPTLFLSLSFECCAQDYTQTECQLSNFCLPRNLTHDTYKMKSIKLNVILNISVLITIIEIIGRLLNLSKKKLRTV